MSALLPQPHYTNALEPPLKWHGGKYYLAKWIISKMPRHLTYCEPFAGGLQVLLHRTLPEVRSNDCNSPGQSHADRRGVAEVVNDIYGLLTNFWEVLANLDLFDEFVRRVTSTPFSQPRSQQATAGLDDPNPVVRAVNFFVWCRQSRSGQCKEFATLTKNRTRGGRNEQANAYLNAVDGLYAVHERLRGVVVLNQDAIKTIRQLDAPDTLFYLDPPYGLETRTTPEVYEYEMTVAQHEELLQAIKDVQGKVMLSGYRNELYDTELAGWVRHDKEIDNKVAGGPTKRRMIESLWCNFPSS